MTDPFYSHMIDAHLTNAGGPMFIGQEIVAALADVTIPPVPEGKVLLIDFTIADPQDLSD